MTSFLLDFGHRNEPSVTILLKHIHCSIWAWGSIVVKALLYYSDDLGIDSQWCHWGFFPWLPTQSCALGSTQHLKMNTRDFS